MSSPRPRKRSASSQWKLPKRKRAPRPNTIALKPFQNSETAFLCQMPAMLVPNTSVTKWLPLSISRLIMSTFTLIVELTKNPYVGRTYVLLTHLCSASKVTSVSQATYNFYHVEPLNLGGFTSSQIDRWRPETRKIQLLTWAVLCHSGVMEDVLCR